MIALETVIGNLVTVCSKKLLVVSTTILYQRPQTTHNKVTAALNQLCHRYPRANLSNLICIHHLQTALKLSASMTTRFDFDLLDQMLICNLQALVHKTYHLNFTNCSLQLLESFLRRFRLDMTLVYQIRH
jgi:hypothetical protein